MADKVKTFDSEYLQEKRERRRKRQKQIQYTIFGVLLFVIIIFLLYMFTPISKISNVKIVGNDNVSKSKIEQYINVKSDSRMYTYSTRKAENSLKKHELIKDAEVRKHFPNKMTVKVTEYKIVGLVKKKDDYVPILENGKQLDSYSGTSTDDGPILDGFKKEKQEKIIQALAKMPANVRSMISEIKYDPSDSSQNQIKLYTSDNLQILGNIKTIASKMKYYPQMSQSLKRNDAGELEKSGYLDLTVGASFIPYSESTNTKSDSDKDVERGTAQADKAKDELQSALNKINKNSKESN